MPLLFIHSAKMMLMSRQSTTWSASWVLATACSVGGYPGVPSQGVQRTVQ
jgi:hypothetical protein